MTLNDDADVMMRKVQLEWNDLAVILAICRSGSLSGAGRSLRLNHSTVFRRINAIEEKTGVRFFDRMPHGYDMTEAGELVMLHAERIEDEVHALGRKILGRDLRLEGKVRVTAPEGIATYLVAPAVAEFCMANSAVSVDLLATSAALDLSRREADIALRVTSKPPDTSLGRRICMFRFCAYATPAYLKENAGHKLPEHRWVMTDGEIDWLIPLIWKNRVQAMESMALSSSLTATAVRAAHENMGVILLPCFRGDSDPALERVAEPFEDLTMELWVLTHPDLRRTARVKALMGYLYDFLRKKSELIEGDGQ